MLCGECKTCFAGIASLVRRVMVGKCLMKPMEKMGLVAWKDLIKQRRTWIGCYLMKGGVGGVQCLCKGNSFQPVFIRFCGESEHKKTGLIYSRFF